jgi:ribonuclease-3
VREAFGPEIEQSLQSPADFKSALQERLARRGAVVSYEVTDESGPPHERTFEVAAVIGGERVAAARALEEGGRAGGGRGRAGGAGELTCT